VESVARCPRQDGALTVTPQLVAQMLGPQVRPRNQIENEQPGVVTGLAYTPAGGEVLHIEATPLSGQGNVTLTVTLAK